VASEPQLTYGGVELLYDKNYQAQSFLDRFLSLNDLRAFTEPITRVNGRTGNLSGFHNNVGLPFPNYPPPPTPRINQLYWPTGASRWAQGLFLASKEAKDLIVAGAYADNEIGPLTLKVCDGVTTLEIPLYLLPPRPISCVPNPSAALKSNTLWLLPLVDVRYYWQWKNFGDNEVANGDTWEELITLLEGQLGITLTVPEFSDDYLFPDIVELSRRCETVPVMLDAVAQSLGLRFLRDVNTDNYILYSFDSSELELAVNETEFNGAWSQIAGDPFDTPLIPENVKVSYPQVINQCGKVVQDGNKVTIKTKEHTSYISEWTNYVVAEGYDKVFHSTCWADYRTGSLANDSELDALAEVIAADYYKSLRRQYDRTFVGIKKWSFVNYDDHVLFWFGVEHENSNLSAITSPDGGGYSTVIREEPERLYLTRVHSVPYNFGVEQQLSNIEDQDAGEPTCSGGGLIIRFHVTSADSETRSVLAEITSVPNGMTVDDMPGQDTLAGVVTVCDPNGCFFNEPSGELIGREGWAAYMQPLEGQAEPCQEEGYEEPQWEVFSLCCPSGECEEPA
jgi:hypothetical protein